ncbi:MAG TPA: MFS transporter [Ktedonobacteraceae bacterium]|nr:MFS transporter [Ktedonobacteraceae bacterium]
MSNKSVAETVQVFAKRRSPSSIPLRIGALCLTSAVTAVNYTNYGPLIPVLRTDLHINNGQAGLMSTLLFLGLAVMYIPAGALADRYGQRPVLIGSSILLAAGGMLLPLFPNFTWLLLCRIITGIGAGGAFVAGAGAAASMGKHSALAQGLYGGSVQIGSGLGLLFTPFLYDWFGWRGAFFFWGLLAISVVITWVIVNDGQVAHSSTRVDVKAGLRSPAVWTLGLSHMGTFGLGNAVAAWIAVFLAHQYGLSLGLAATLGSLALLTGMFFRPLGGILIGRGIIGAIPLLRMGTIMGFFGVAFLALPLRIPFLVVVGMGLIAIGATIPYTSVFNEAARLRDVGKGVAQGLVSIISVPTVILGPPLIGFLFGYTGNFSLAFGSILIFSAIAVTSSFLAGPAVSRETISSLQSY